VIPKVFRDEMGIAPGDEVVFEEESGQKRISLKKETVDLVSYMREFSRKHARKGFRYESGKAYEEMMEERFGKYVVRRRKLK